MVGQRHELNCQSETQAGKHVWPVVIGILSIVLATQSLIDVTERVIRYVNFSRSTGESSIEFVPSLFLSPYFAYVNVVTGSWKCWPHIIFIADLLLPMILLVGGAVLIREWQQDRGEYRWGSLLHRLYGCAWLIWFLMVATPNFFPIWWMMLGSTGLDGHPNDIEHRVRALLLLVGCILPGLISNAYPIFLLVWFRKYGCKKVSETISAPNTSR